MEIDKLATEIDTVTTKIIEKIRDTQQKLQKARRLTALLKVASCSVNHETRQNNEIQNITSFP